MENNVVVVEDLNIRIKLDEGMLTPVRGVSFQVRENETLGLVGESGCGKSLTSKAILGINDKKCVTTGKINFTVDGRTRNLLDMKFGGPEIRSIRGKSVSMIFQEPMSSFSPLFTIGHQISESVRLHIDKDKDKAREITIDAMRKVGIANPEKRYNQYPHEFSGGMLQRALIAMALVCNPKLLIADEPTTALDVTIQAQIIKLLKEIQKKNDTSVIMITHDLGIVAGMADYISVMYAGRIVEQGTVFDIFNNPQHPYTYALLKAVPSLENENKAALQIIPGTPPDLIAPPKGCGFANRCRYCMKVCEQINPEYTELSKTHKAACWLHHPLAKQAFKFDDVREVLEDDR